MSLEQLNLEQWLEAMSRLRDVSVFKPLPTGQRVEILDVNKRVERRGRIVGYGILETTRTLLQPAVLVALDEGFYSPEETCWVSTLIVHPDNIRRQL